MKHLFVSILVVGGCFLFACDLAPGTDGGVPVGGTLSVFIDDGRGERECTADPCLVPLGDVVAGRDDDRFTVRLLVDGDEVAFDSLQGEGSCSWAFAGELDSVAREEVLAFFAFNGTTTPGDTCAGALELPNNSSNRPALRLEITAQYVQGNEPGDDSGPTYQATCNGTVHDACILDDGTDGFIERTDCAAAGARCVAGAGCVGDAGDVCEPDVAGRFLAPLLCAVGDSFIDCFEAAAELDADVCP